MKKIKLRKSSEQVESIGILRLVATNSPNKPLGVDEMRRRVRVLDALDALEPDAEYLTLEDEDIKILCAAVETFPWSTASKELLEIIEDILHAETVPSPMKLVRTSEDLHNGKADQTASSGAAKGQGIQ